MFSLSSDAALVCGVLIIVATTVVLGGNFVLQASRGKVPATDFQLLFARTGHGHAGAFVTLGLVAAVLADATHLSGPAMLVARLGVPLASVVLPAGFFLSSMGAGRTEPNRAQALIWLGAALLVTGMITLGVGLLAAA